MIVSTHLGDTLFTDQLYYERLADWLFTDNKFRYISDDKEIYGVGFNSDKTFEKIKFLEVTGYVSFKE